jgi:hypothetical protein
MLLPFIEHPAVYNRVLNPMGCDDQTPATTRKIVAPFRTFAGINRFGIKIVM